MMQFTPLEDFFSDELQSQYCVGLSYTVKDDAAHAKLAALVPKWLAEGKVRQGGADDKAIAAHFAGSGKVE
jgi:hypothetical protein